MLFIFGGFLLYTAGKLLFSNNEAVDPANSKFLKLVHRFIPTTPELHGQKMFVRIDHKRWATPLFAVLLLIEATDVLFAVDSVPAVLAVSKEQFIVFTSNAFAIMGLRSLYFMLADMHARFTLSAAGTGDHPRLRRRQDDHQPLVPHPDGGVVAGHHHRARGLGVVLVAEDSSRSHCDQRGPSSSRRAVTPLG